MHYSLYCWNPKRKFMKTKYNLSFGGFMCIGIPNVNMGQTVPFPREDLYRQSCGVHGKSTMNAPRPPPPQVIPNRRYNLLFISVSYSSCRRQGVSKFMVPQPPLGKVTQNGIRFHGPLFLQKLKKKKNHLSFSILLPLSPFIYLDHSFANMNY